MLIDTHCHISFPEYKDDREDVLKRALDNGVEHIIAIGAGAGVDDGNIGALELARKHDYISASLGIHPHDAKMYNADALNKLKQLASDKSVVAWGEIGLDYHYDLSPRDVQRFAFEAQLKDRKSTRLNS